MNFLRGLSHVSGCVVFLIVVCVAATLIGSGILAAQPISFGSKLILMSGFLVVMAFLFVGMYRFQDIGYYVNDQSDIGNVMALYFTNLSFSFLRGRDFSPLIFHNANTKSQIVANLPSRVTCSTPPLFIPEGSKLGNGVLHTLIHRFGFNCNMEGTDEILESIQPTVRKVIKEAIPTNIWEGVDTNFDIAVHYRCSDSPFNRDPYYSLAYHRLVLDSVKDFANRTGRDWTTLRVRLITAPSHQRGCNNAKDGCKSAKDNAEACHEYVQSLISYLDSAGLEHGVEIQSKSIDEDFTTMMRAPCLISLKSSMSYLAALASDSYAYVALNEKETPNAARRREKWIELPSNGMVKQSDVRDWYDVETVCELLSSQ